MDKKYYYEEISQSLGSTIIRRTDESGDEAWIPKDASNRDYADYLASLEATEPEAE